MKILYLYSEVLGYTMATIRELAESGNELHVVHWDHKKLTPYQAPALPNVIMYKRSGLSVSDLKILASNIRPAITVVSGWMDSGYMAVARQLRGEGAPVLMGVDNHWHGSLKQWLTVFLGSMGYFKKFYSHAWVSGPNQYEYVRRLGFAKNKILFDLYCADLRLFSRAYTDSIANKEKHYPHRFLFVGRLEAVKGLDLLAQAWRILEKKRGDWELHLIGSGSLKSTLENSNGIFIQDFMQPEELVSVVSKAGCFVLPSRGEPWGVVVHEFAAAGLPIIASDVVGAASTFLIPGVNGFKFEANDPRALAKAMQKIMLLSDHELHAMAIASQSLSRRITPVTSAGSLLAALNS
jgi:glycosyltransferase involved in cell wall biosynthesis